MTTKSKVDLVVGIDFGMTFTGVAYSTLKMPTPRVVQKWPGKTGETHNKAPTTILYTSSSSRLRETKEWGFQCHHSEHKKEWFKRFLDPLKLSAFKENDDDLPDLDEVRQWYKDYMACLYKHLSSTIQSTTGKWESKSIEFVFSLPSTFNTPSLAQDLRTLMIQAGFGSGGTQHEVHIDLTEPEAAAVYTVKEAAVNFQIGDVFLVCDAGGGTTDLAILEVVGDSDGEPDLKELVVIEGQDIGSTNIDLAFEKMVEERLKIIKPKLDSGTAWTMMHKADYTAWKCAFGHEDSKNLAKFTVSVPKTNTNFNHDKAKIKKGKMNFSHPSLRANRKDFRGLFDPEIEKMVNLIIKQLASLRKRSPKTKINYMVLSGGLGSSAYVRSKLEEEFLGGTDQTIAPDLQILGSEEPQLAVVKGVVIDRIQKLKRGKAVLQRRISRASYGIKEMELYNEKKHIGQDVFRAIDGNLKGETIDLEKPVCEERYQAFLADDSREFHVHVIMSLSNTKDLPTHIGHADVDLVCKVKLDFSHIPLDKFVAFPAPGRIPGFKSKPYYRVYYEFKFIVGPSDISFEYWFQGVRYASKEHVAVEWDYAS